MLAAVLGLLATAGVVRAVEGRPGDRPAGRPTAASSPPATVGPGRGQGRGPDEPPAPTGRIFGHGRFLVAYYGTASTGALGVLGESDPDTAFRRLTRAAAPFARPRQPVQPVFELIVTVADAVPGPDGDYSHDIARADVRRWIAAARRHGVLLLLDLQPGRAGFLEVAERWAWALRHPHVGLALDPEWRMGRHEVPGRVLGSVDAPEVNAVARWLVALQRRHGLPQKLFVLHQFRADMIEHLGQVQQHPGLAMVQHVDGFGTPEQKRATFHAVAQPKKFYLGFKLFYDEDTRLMSPDEVHRLRPKVRFVSFQ
ncbi:hypothetical protein BH11ACT8_BH11ACT8_10590 [soil metagenome]